MSLGSLRVLLGLDAAEFTRGLSKAEAEAQKFQRSMVSLGRNVGAVLGTALSAGAFVSMVKGAIDAADRLNDLSKKTGVAVETLGGLGFAATQAGGDLETTVAGLGKLNKTIAEAAAGNKEASEFFQKLGIDVRDSNKQIKDAGSVYVEIAGKFERFADGPNKAALALRGFGKSGQDQIPVLNEGAEALRKNIDYYRQFSGVTAETARQADEFNDTMGRLGLMAKSLGTRIATELLPFLQVLAGEFQKTGEEGVTAFDSIAKGFSNFFRNISIAGVQIKYVISTVIKDIREFDSYMQQFMAGNAQAAKAIREGAAARSEADRAEVDRLTRALANAVNNKPLPGIGLENIEAALRKPANRKPDAPGLRSAGSGGADKAAQEQKKLLDKQLSDIDNFIKAEKRALETRESDLQRLYQNDQISTAAYFDERIAALNQHTTATVDSYNKQIKAQEAFAAASRKRKDEPAAIDAETKIGDIQARIADVLHEKQQRELNLRDDLTQAAQAYADQINEVRARVLELVGTEKAALEAAKLRFDIQNRPAIQAAKREQNPALAADIAALRAQSDAQTQINNLLKDAGVIEQNLATAQAKLHLERDLGMRDEIDTLGLVGRASGEAAAKLKLIADQYLAIAMASKDPQIIANALALKQRVDELAAATDILAAKIRQTFVDTGASAIETFLNSMAEGKNALDSFKAAFTQFANDIIRQINRIAAQKIADSLFKGGSGGDGGIFGSIADAFVSYVGGISGREKGGLVSGQTPYVVGERGPEIFVPQTVAAAATKQIDSLIAQRGRPVEYTDHVRAVATNLPHLIGAKGPEIFVPKVDGIVIPNNKVAKLSAVLERRATAEVTRRREISAPLAATRTILRDEKITTRYANAPYSKRATGGPVTAHVPYIVGEQGREIFLPKSAKAIQRSKQAVADLVASAPLQRRSSGGAVEGSTSYVVGELGPELFMPQSAARIINNEIVHNDRVASNTRNEKIINQFVSNIQRKSFAGGPAQAEKIIKNENSVSVVTTNARRNEKVINDLISKTVQHHAETNDKIINRLGTTTRTNEPPIVEARRFIPKVADRIIKSAQRINDLVSNIEHRRSEKHIDEIISSVMRRRAIENQTAAASIVGNRGREIFIPKSVLVQKKRLAPELPSAAFGHIVGEFGPEIFVPKTAGRIIKNERAIDVLVNASHQKSHGVRDVIYRDKADGIKVPSDFFTNQQYHRANGGVVAANQPYLVGERGAEAFVPKNRVFASGTDFVPRDGPAYLHRGERVVTADDNKNGRWNKGDTNINITVPGGTNAATANQIAAAVSRQMAISNARYN